MDQVVNADHIPVTGETILAGDISKVPGGKGANQAYSIAKLGGIVSMLGAVGKDDSGKYILNNLMSVGVDTSRIRKYDGINSGTAWIIVDRKGNNSITVIPGANDKVDKSYIDENMDFIKAAEIIILQLEIPVETVKYVVKIAKKLGKCIILDPAPAVLLENDILECVDILKPNETEAGILTGMDSTDYVQICKCLRHKGVKNVLLSLGEKGIYADLDNGIQELFPGIQVTVVDTTAAGDSFIAGMAAALSEGRTIVEAIHFGQRVASIAVTRKGAQSSIPSREEI